MPIQLNKGHIYTPIISFEEDSSREFEESQTKVTIGNCNIGGENVQCIKKVFDDTQGHLFHGAIQALCILRFNEGLKKVFPHVIHFDYKNLTVYMAVIRGETVENYIKNYDFSKSSKPMEKMLIELKRSLKILESHHVLHGDLHLGNIMYIDRDGDRSVKFIDIDEATIGDDYKEQRRDLSPLLKSTIFSRISDDINNDLIPNDTRFYMKYAKLVDYIWKKYHFS